MAQYVSQVGREHVEPVVSTIASPIPLGMSALAFTTAILGASYAGFIVPSDRVGINLAVGAALFYGSIVQLLAGMWEFRKDNTLAATIFSSYGGFLGAFGVTFLPGVGIYDTLFITGALRPALGLFFLCWTIFTAVLFLGSLRTNIALLVVLGLLFLTYLFLAIGELAGGNTASFMVGGWLGIICGLVAWYYALAGMLASANGPPFRLPVGQLG